MEMDKWGVRRAVGTLDGCDLAVRCDTSGLAEHSCREYDEGADLQLVWRFRRVRCK